MPLSLDRIRLFPQPAREVNRGSARALNHRRLIDKLSATALTLEKTGGIPRQTGGVEPKGCGWML